MPRKSRAADAPQAESKNQRILAAAARAFAEADYHQVRTEDIAAAAGVAKGTVFRYYASKEELFVATVVHSVEAMSAEIDQALPELADPLARLEAVCRRLVDFYRRHECLFRLLHGDKALAEQPRHQELHSRQHQLREKIAQLIRAGQAAGRLRAFDPAVAARFLFGLVRTALRGEELRDQPPERVADLILELFMNGLRAGPKSGRRR